ncbi:hypothetical protein MCOR07_002575 [Pyricularia oryzae]|uniref:Velvet domain-containing protein n=1 Tax=Pyricularia grisea TaxID=148305 RepID=A0ABQ8NTC9_PYRGI|nr:hypothetical protein MCOR01_007140 [Pyricularia oryzae]KAI6301876.1 hypothetical protein MCOR33_002716 [Pyricularia grisea]KAI6280806.1 hypothetical protein MCOR26_003570 [Pyricularia oryzae]KAI6417253.1 hypothetical protein MCOR20_000437 [Pyricularia oryzae]KAI6431756.1 hypothetical protein MCOR24_001548 [Pyricularia oryzae]
MKTAREVPFQVYFYETPGLAGAIRPCTRLTHVNPNTTSAVDPPTVAPLQALSDPQRAPAHQPEACVTFSRCRLPAHPNLILEQDEFVVVYELTETDRTVIFGRYGGFWCFHNLVILGRVSIDYLGDIHCPTRMTFLSYGYQVDKASRRPDGVLRSF